MSERLGVLVEDGSRVVHIFVWESEDIVVALGDVIEPTRNARPWCRQRGPVGDYVEPKPDEVTWDVYEDGFDGGHLVRGTPHCQTCFACGC